MTNLTTYPLIDGFETTLAQSWNGATGTVFLNTAPSFTFPSGVKTYIVVNPGKTTMQVGRIDSMNVGNKTVNVDSVTIEKGAGLNYTAQIHAVGSKVIISDNYEFWKDIATAINSKADTARPVFTGSITVPIYADATARNAAIPAPADGMIVKTGNATQVYNSGTAQWEDFDIGTPAPNASTTVKGLVQIATDAEVGASTTTGSTGAQLAVNPGSVTKTSNGSADENKLPALNASGQLDAGFINNATILGEGVEALVDKDTYRLGENVTAGDNLFVEDVVDGSIVINTADSHGVSMAQSGVTTTEQGVRITPKNNIQMKTVTKDGSCDATRATIRDDSGTLISSATFSGNVATFGDVILLKGIVYRIQADSNGASYTGRRKVTADVVYAILGTNIEYISGYNAGIVTNQIWNIATITSDNIKDITTIQNIGDVTNNTRLSIPVIGSGVASNTLKLALRKYVSPGVDLGVRIETDNAGEPSGTIVTNGTSTVLTSGLTTSLVDTTVTLAGSVTLTEGTKYHIVLFAGTYGAETVNGTNYFGVGNNTNNTTTRKTLVWNGTNRLITYAAAVTDADNLTFSSTNAAAAARGYRMQAREDLYITTITKSATSNATRVQIKSDAGANLATYSFSGNVATLTTPLLFTKDQYFRLECDNNASSYTSHRLLSATFPQNRTNVNYISGSEDGSSAGASGTTAFNIDSVGTTLLSNVFIYTTSTLFNSKLLSKTDATYSYKLPTDIPRIATESKGTGENVIATTLGLNDNFSGLTPLAKYYISNTPGVISSTVGTNVYPLGQAIDSTTLNVVRKYGVGTISTLNTTVAAANTTVTSTSYLATFDAEFGFIFDLNVSGASSSTTGSIQYSTDNSTRYTMQTESIGAGASRSYRVVPIITGRYYRTSVNQNVNRTGGTTTITLDMARPL